LRREGSGRARRKKSAPDWEPSVERERNELGERGRRGKIGWKIYGCGEGNAVELEPVMGEKRGKLKRVAARYGWPG